MPMSFFFFFLIDSLVLIEMLLKFTKKDILNGMKLTCFLFPFCLTWFCRGLEAEKEHCIRNVWSWEWNVGHCAHSCRPPDGNKPFSKKTWKEMTIVNCDKINIFLLYLLQIHHFDSFLAFLEYFQLKHLVNLFKISIW